MSWKLKSKAKAKLAGEIGTFYKEHAEVSVALAFPNTYFVGMSNLGLQTIYRLLNERKDTLCERVFLPDKDELAEFKRTNTPLFSLEHQKSLLEFDIVGFSVSFEMDYFCVLKILELANIPPRAQHRDERHPLIIAGGPAVTANPEPLAEFIDLFILGDGEEAMNRLIDFYLRHKVCSRQELLGELSKIAGVYIPSCPTPLIHRNSLRHLDNYPARSCIVTPHTEFSRMFLIEVERGCPRGCKFCLASYLYRPYRYRSLECLIRQVEEGLKMTSKIGLIGSALSDYPHLLELCRKIKAAGGQVSLSSLRIDALSAALLHLLDQQTIALAPEAGSFRLRKAIGKGVTDEEILNKVEMLNSFQPALKLYFMVGLPTEEQADLEALCALAKKIKTIFKGRLHLSINPFVPKTYTPFQDVPMDSESSLKKKLAFLKQEIKGIRISGESVKNSVVQGSLSLGSREDGVNILTRTSQ